MPNPPTLEDELGDVLDKAMRNAGLNEEQLAAATGIDVSRIKDAEDYRYDLSCAELQKLATALGLNEVGVCALGENKYPLPRLPVLPFELHVLAQPYGIGRVNAGVVFHPETRAALLFDTGRCAEGLDEQWPAGMPDPVAIWLTHWDRDHAGGLDWARARWPAAAVLAPGPGGTRPVEPVGEGDERAFGGFQVRTYRTPGHTQAHNAYLVRTARGGGRGVLFSGDLVFAGSLGGAFFCCRTLLREVRRVLNELPADTVIAPGHGPLTTVGNERRYNPFLG